jgi:hypothetical protein
MSRNCCGITLRSAASLCDIGLSAEDPEFMESATVIEESLRTMQEATGEHRADGCVSVGRCGRTGGRNWFGPTTTGW